MAEELNSLEELIKSKSLSSEEAGVKRESVKDTLGRSYATGKRKDAVARVWI